jgi:hypothetical protein
MKVGDKVKLKSTVKAEQLGYYDWDGNDVSASILPLTFTVTMVDLKYAPDYPAHRTFVESGDFGGSFPDDWLEIC